MPVLHELPLELILLIFNDVALRSRPATLELSVLSKSINMAINPILYSTVHLDHSNLAKFHNTVTKNNKPYHQYVKALSFFQYSPDFGNNLMFLGILSICENITGVTLTTPFTGSDDREAFLRLQNVILSKNTSLSRLLCSPASFGPLLPDTNWTEPIYANITHLVLTVVFHDFHFETIRHLPRVTHIAFWDPRGFTFVDQNLRLAETIRLPQSTVMCIIMTRSIGELPDTWHRDVDPRIVLAVETEDEDDTLSIHAVKTGYLHRVHDAFWPSPSSKKDLWELAEPVLEAQLKLYGKD